MKWYDLRGGALRAVPLRCAEVAASHSAVRLFLIAGSVASPGIVVATSEAQSAVRHVQSLVQNPPAPRLATSQRV